MLTVSLSSDLVYSLTNVGGETELENASQNLCDAEFKRPTKERHLKTATENNLRLRGLRNRQTTEVLWSVECIDLTNVEFKLTSRLRREPSRTNSVAAHNRRTGARDLSGTCPSSS